VELHTPLQQISRFSRSLRGSRTTWAMFPSEPDSLTRCAVARAKHLGCMHGISTCAASVRLCGVTNAFRLSLPLDVLGSSARKNE
jgi:hypothetical protein